MLVMRGWRLMELVRPLQLIGTRNSPLLSS